jgi:hypothetical protein
VQKLNDDEVKEAFSIVAVQYSLLQLLLPISSLDIAQLMIRPPTMALSVVAADSSKFPVRVICQWSITRMHITDLPSAKISRLQQRKEALHHQHIGLPSVTRCIAKPLTQVSDLTMSKSLDPAPLEHFPARVRDLQYPAAYEP